MIIIKNYMEKLVEDEMDSYLGENSKEMCLCERCKKDIMAYTLNQLPPKYIVSEKGYIYERIGEMKQQFKVDVLKAVIKAVNIVSEHPSH